MKKILYMTMLFGHGGIEKYMLNIFDHIDRSKYSFDVALPGKFKQQNEDALLGRGINVIHYSAASIGQQVKEIKRILEDGDYDIVHVMQSYVTLETYAIFALVSIAERRKHHYKVICHAHGTEDKTRAIGPVKKTLRSIYRAAIRKGFSKADMLVGCSREAGEFLYGKSEKIHVFYNGIQLDVFGKRYTEGERLALKEKYCLKDGEPSFVAVARMTDQKNPLFMVDVVKHLCRHYPDLCLVWVGDGELRNDIVRKVEDNGLAQHIHFTGVQSNVGEILACCDYFLLPSKQEGAPLVYLEAQAAGLKCFASDRVPDVIDCGGVSFIALDQTAEEWAAEIQQQIEKEPKPNIHPDLLKRFDINETVLALSRVYDSLTES